MTLSKSNSPPKLQIPAHWEFGLQRMNLVVVGGTHSVYHRQEERVNESRSWPYANHFNKRDRNTKCSGSQEAE